MLKGIAGRVAEAWGEVHGTQGTGAGWVADRVLGRPSDPRHFVSAATRLPALARTVFDLNPSVADKEAAYRIGRDLAPEAYYFSAPARGYEGGRFMDYLADLAEQTRSGKPYSTYKGPEIVGPATDPRLIP